MINPLMAFFIFSLGCLTFTYFRLKRQISFVDKS